MKKEPSSRGSSFIGKTPKNLEISTLYREVTSNQEFLSEEERMVSQKPLSNNTPALNFTSQMNHY